MALRFADAMAYVTACIGYDPSKPESAHPPEFKCLKYRNFAVSDFERFIADISPIRAINAREYQNAWARYLVYVRAGLMSNVESKEYRAYYHDGKDFASKPIIKAADYKPQVILPEMPGYKEAATDLGKVWEVRVKGVGECNYFAEQAYNLLSSRSAFKSGVPRVDKISCGIHNLVRVNYPEPVDDIFGGAAPDLTDTIFVDYWLLALGCPLDRCICRWASAAKMFRGSITVVQTHNPDKQD